MTPSAKPTFHRDLLLYRRLLRWVRPYGIHLFGVVIFSLLAMPLALLVPVPLKIAIDSGLAGKPIPQLLQPLLPGGFHLTPNSALIFAVALLIAVAALRQLQTLAVTLLGTYTGEKLLLDFRSSLFRQMQRLSLSFHEIRGTSQALYNVQYDAAAIQAIAVQNLSPVLGAAFTLAGMLYVTMKMDWQLALLAMLTCPLLFGLARVYRPRLRSRSREARALEKTAMGVVQEVLGALRVVKAFGREDGETKRFVRCSFEGMTARIKLAVAGGKFNALVGLTAAAGTAAVLFVGFQQVEAHVITLGDLILIMGYVAQLYDPLKTLGKNSAALQTQLASIERAFALLDETPEVEERSNARRLDRAAGDLAFENVSFSYGVGRPALQGVSFRVEPGMRVGIVGHTGAGKSTMISLMLRFYDPNQGRILLDGVDTRDYRLADFRKQFALVPQDPVLFSSSVAENIAYARPEACFDEIEAAARAANAHGFISRLPQGYQTLVGERGLRISGGERQRISLARAFLKNAPILILDEPTSSVDVRTESGILEALDRLMAGRTAFLVAHRASTLRPCNLLLHMEQGKLVAAASSPQDLTDFDLTTSEDIPFERRVANG